MRICLCNAIAILIYFLLPFNFNFFLLTITFVIRDPTCSTNMEVTPVGEGRSAFDWLTLEMPLPCVLVPPLVVSRSPMQKLNNVFYSFS